MNGNAVTPRVSVIMANFNGAAHIAEAVRSVLRQTERSLELIVSDDGSNDASLDIARETARGDPRLVLQTSEAARTGPAAARNRALRIARGEWIAIVDNDDFIHPERLEGLIRAAEADGADIAADDLLVFYQEGDRFPHPHLRGRLAKAPGWISAAEYERSNRILSGRRPLGYLKPIFRRALAAAYDETLRIGEDADLILRLLAGGARMRVYPEPRYFYRKHARSISHRLDAAAVDAMDRAYQRLDTRGDAALAREVERGRTALADARAFTDLIAALKARDLSRSFATAIKRPSALRLLKDPIAARLRFNRRRETKRDGRRVTLLSRQRIIGSTNGSSAYVLALVRSLKREGYAVDYLGASPKIFGRWAALQLRPETAVFDRYLVKGGARIGSFVIALDPARWAAAALAVLALGMRRLGLPAPGWERPADYAQGAQATRSDLLFVARHAAAGAAAVLCDYAFLAPLAPYAFGKRSLVIMHDLMSARSDSEGLSIAPRLTPEREFSLLGMADIVLAIQKDEADAVRERLPAVVLASHATDIADAPQPGEDDRLLFVGSNTASNVEGLNCFYHGIWPAIRALRPHAKLTVVGSVSRALEAPPKGVRHLDVTSDLSALYREASVVISPLFAGSGLKIKLIDALAAGKAVVGTTVTTQGVQDFVSSAIVIEDDPQRFAEAVAKLLTDQTRRADLGARALACARSHFSPDRCFDAFVAAVNGDLPLPATDRGKAALPQDDQVVASP